MSSNANVGGIEYTATIELQEFIRGQREIETRMGQIEKQGDRLDRTMTTVAKAVAGAVAAIQLGNLVSDLIKTQRQFDVMNASLKTLTGSQEAANAAFDKLKTFAATTPYDLEQVVGAFTKMKALGLDPSERALTSFGNTASAMGKNLNQMVEAVADAATGEFERLKEFGIKASKQGEDVTFTFQGVETTIKASAENITEYLTNLGEVNFAGAMADRMDTLDGRISNLQDSLQDLYRAVNESGFGEAVAQSVTLATEAIQEMAKSIQGGELTEYFDGVKKILPVVEVAVMSLAGAMASRLVAAFIATATQAAASATAMGAATIAARGFAGALALVGGPIGIAITALGLLALNWDKVSGAADNAAGINERAAQRIKAALAKSGEEQAKALSDTKKSLEDQLGAAQNVEENFKKWGTGTPKQIEAARERVAALKQAIVDVSYAMRRVTNPDEFKPQEPGAAPPPPPPPKPAGGGSGAAGNNSKAQKFKFDAEAYLAGLKMANLKELDLIEAQEAEKLRRNAQLLDEQKITLQQAEEAKTAIQTRATEQREALYERERDASMAAAEQKRKEIEQAAAAEQAGKDKAVANADGIINRGDAVAQLEAKYAEEQAALNADLEKKWLSEEKWAQATIELHAQKEERLKQLAADREQAERENNMMMLAGASQMFGGMADLIAEFGGKQSGAYKAMFAVSKAFAIAQGTLALYGAALKAMDDPTAFTLPQKLANYAAVLGAGGKLLATIKGASFGGGRQYGGPISDGKFYRVNETGAPEMYTASTGQQYMLPNKSGKITPANKLGGGAGGGGPAGVPAINMSTTVNAIPMPNGWFAMSPETFADTLKTAVRDGYLAGFKG